MSKKKVTSTANIPRIGVTDHTYPLGNNRVSMERGYGRPGEPRARVIDNPLEQIKLEKQHDLLKVYREMQAKKEELKLQKELSQMKREIGSVNTTGGGLKMGEAYNFSAQDITAISNMPDNEKQNFLETMQKITAMSAMSPRGGAGSQGMNPMLQWMAMGGFNRQGSGLGLKDIMELQKTWQTIYAPQEI